MIDVRDARIWYRWNCGSVCGQSRQ